MTDVHIDKGNTAKLGRVEGELRAGRNVRIEAEDGETVVVSGGAHFEGNAEIGCDFECDSLTVDRGKLMVTGNLTVAKRLDVAHTVKANGSISAQDIDVGGRMIAKTVSCEGLIRVGGLLETSEKLEAKSVEVGGMVTVSGTVRVVDLAVGGKAEIGGGSITGNTRIGGVFTSSAPLQFGALQVYGRCKLPADCKGEKMSTFGKLSVGGRFTCEQVDVGGSADVHGDFNAREVLVNGKLFVSGSLAAKGMVETNGFCEVRTQLSATELRVGGWLRAGKAMIGDSADIAGAVETEHGLRGKTIVIRSGTRCRGVLVGGRVELGKSPIVIANWSTRWAGQKVQMRGIGRMTSAEDIYGAEVVLGSNVRCGKIFANRVEVNEGCTIDQVTYTDEFRRGAGRAFLTHPSAKVASLPPFPL